MFEDEFDDECGGSGVLLSVRFVLEDEVKLSIDALDLALERRKANDDRSTIDLLRWFFVRFGFDRSISGGFGRWRIVPLNTITNNILQWFDPVANRRMVRRCESGRRDRIRQWTRRCK